MLLKKKESILIDAISFLGRFWQKRFAYVLIVLLINIAGFCYFFYYLNVNGYLPSPFMADKSDTFMDLFNPMYWAYDDNRYSIWRSVYPPLNFFLLKFLNFFFDGNHYGDPEFIRENSYFVIFGFGLSCLLSLGLVFKTRLWQEFALNEKIIIFFVSAFSAPLLFGFERGNIILLMPALLAAVLSEIGFLRALCIALSINIKPYFVILLFYYMVRKDRKGFITCTIMATFIFVLSGLVLDRNFIEFFSNMLNFSQNDAIFSLRELMGFPSSISAISVALNTPDGANFVEKFLAPINPALLSYVIDLTKWSVIAFSLFFIFLRCRLISDSEILAILVVIISNLGIWVGGYTLILYVTLIPIFIKMHRMYLYIACLSIIAIPLDVVPLVDGFSEEQYSYLASANVHVEWTLGLGSLVRPIVNLVLLVSLSYEIFVRKRENITKNL